MSLFHTVLLGIVEGITEFLPVSSTGHLIIAEKILGIPSTEALKTFDITIQLGAITAALIVYWNSLLKSRKTIGLVIAAFIPTAILGAVLHGPVKHYLLGNASVVAWTLFLGGIALIAFEYLHDEKKASIHAVEQMSYIQAIATGAIQTLAVIPGTSRSAATIVGGMALGISRKTIVDFSFLLAIPTMAGATALDVIKTSSVLTSQDMMMIGIGFFVSFVSAYASIRWLLRYVQSHTFIAFGIYRIAAACFLWAFIL